LLFRRVDRREGRAIDDHVAVRHGERHGIGIEDVEVVTIRQHHIGRPTLA